MREELSFWLAVGLVAVASVAIFKVLAAHAGDRFPALRDLGAFI